MSSDVPAFGGGGGNTPLQDNVISPLVSRCNSKKKIHPYSRPTDCDEPEPDGRPTGAPDVLQEKLADTMWRQLGRFQDKLFGMLRAARVES